MEHLLVRLLSHESHVFHMYSYVMIRWWESDKMICWAVDFGLKKLHFQQVQVQSQQSLCGLIDLTSVPGLDDSEWPESRAFRHRRTAIGEAARIQAILKGWWIFGDNEFHKSFNFQDCKKQVKKQVALLQYFCFQFSQSLFNHLQSGRIGAGQSWPCKCEVNFCGCSKLPKNQRETTGAIGGLKPGQTLASA